MSLIAEAFVAVRPNTDDFAKELRAQLATALRDFKPPPIKVTVTVDQTSLTALKKKLAENPIKVPVELTLAPGTTTRLREKILAAAAIKQPIPISVTPTRAAAAAGAVASGGVGTARGGAVSEIEKAEDRLAQLRTQVNAAMTDAAKRTSDLVVAQDRLVVANQALAASEKAVKDAREKGTAATLAQATATRDEALEAQKLAATRVGVLGGLQGGAAPKPGGSTDPLGVISSQKAASAELAAALQLQAAATETSNQALIKQADALVLTKTRSLEAASAAVTEANARIEAATAANAAASAASTAAKQSAREIGVAQAEALKLNQQFDAVQASISKNVAQQANVANAGATATTEIEAARRKLTAANSAATAAEANLEKATAFGAKGLIAQAEAAEVAALSLVDVRKSALAAALAQRELGKVQDVLQRVENQVGIARQPVGETPLERARNASSSAIAASRSLLVVQEQVAAGTLVLGKAELERLAVLEATIPALATKTKLEYADVKALQTHTAASAQASRGALATSASFLGLRGAVLSSSLPFLIATVAVTAFAKTIGSAGQFEQSLNTFQATTGATNEQMKEIAATAQQLGRDLTLPSTSANDAAAAMTELSKAGLSVNDTIDATRGVLELSAAANLTAAEAAKISATQLNAFGLAGDQAGRVTDLLAAASISAQGEITDFAAAFQQVSAQAKQSGLSIEQTTTLLTQLAKAGIRGSDAGTSLRVELLRLVPSTKPAIEAFARLGIEIDRTQTIGAQLPAIIQQFSEGLAKFNPQTQTKLIRDIFGQDASRAAIITLTEGLGVYYQTQQAVTQVGAAATLTAAKAKGLTGAIDGLQSVTQNLAGSIGADLLPVLTPVVTTLSEIVQQADLAINALDPLVGTIGDFANFTFGGGETAAQIVLVVAGAAAVNRQIEKRIALSAKRKAAEITEATTAGKAATIEVAAQAKVTESILASLRAEEALALAYGATARAAQISAEIQFISNQKVAASQGAALGGFLGKAKGLGGTKLSIAGLTAGIVAQIAGDRIGGTAGGFLSAAGTGASIGSFFGLPGLIGGTAAGLAIEGLETLSAKEERERKAAQAAWDSKTYVQQIAFVNQVGNKKFVQIAQFLGWKLKPNPFQGSALDLPTTPQPAGSSLGIFDPIGLNAKAIAADVKAGAAVVGPAAQAALAIAQGELTGNTDLLIKTYEGILERQKQREQTLRYQIRFGQKTSKELAILTAQLAKNLQNQKATNDIITQLIADSISAFNPEVAANELAKVQAQGTVTKSDDLATAQQTVSIYEELLRTTDATGQALADLRVKLAQARNEVTNIQQGIAADAQQARDDQASAQLLVLQRSAEASDNQGAAEKALLAELKRRVQESKGNALEYQQATNELIAEQKKFAEAVQTSIQLSFDVRASALDAAEAAANLTDSTADNLKVERARQKLIDQEIAAAIRLRQKYEEGTDEWKRTQIKINGLKAQRDQIEKEIRGITEGGISSNDLFKEAINQLTTFGSNVSGTPTTPGGAAISVLLGSQSGKMSQADREKLAAAAQTNSTLDQMLILMKANQRHDLPGQHTGELEYGADYYALPPGQRSMERTRRMTKVPAN